MRRGASNVAVGPVMAGSEVDGLEGAVEAERVAGLDLAEHLGWDERCCDGRERFAVSTGRGGAGYRGSTALVHRKGRAICL